MISHVTHLVSRFFGSIFAKPLTAKEQQVLNSELTSPLLELFDRLSVADQRHLYNVSRGISAEVQSMDLDSSEAYGLVVAGLFHDCGKVVSDFGTIMRVIATLYWGLLPKKLASMLSKSVGGLGVRMQQYRDHPRIGSELLIEADAPQIAATWAKEHHKPADAWTIETKYGELLKRYDDD